MKTLFTFLFITGVFFGLNAQTNDKKLALVIGNSNYQHGGTLKNPVNDANLIAKTLKSLNFEVILKTDADLKTMQIATAEFTNKIEKYKVALFYYAGHGIQLDGENYLIPVDAKIDDKTMCKFEAFNINYINQAFQVNQSNMNIMILDACRNNPFRSWMRGSSRGFKVVSDQAAGTIIAFATREGETASDGTGNNGLFTEKLAMEMSKPQNITEVFQNTRIEVLKESKNTQCPQEWNMLTSNFYFIEPSYNNINQNITNNNNVEEEVVFNPGNTEITYGSISLDTEIEGELYLDDKKLGSVKANSKANKLNKIIAGEHKIEIKGSENFIQKIDVKQNEVFYLKVEKSIKNIVKVPSINEKNLVQITDKRDNKLYKTVKIGNQLWMAENLNYDCEGSWYYENLVENGKKFGKLYTFEAANKACPLGWHLPSDIEWQELETSIGMDKGDLEKTSFRGMVANKMKSNSGWNKEKNGTDEFGFNILPGGYRDFNGKGAFLQLEKQSYFWSSSSKGTNNAWRRDIHFGSEGISRMNFDQNYAYSVRCVKD